MKILALIQARIGSSRLPNKMMLSLHGIPLIEWVVKRVQQSKNINDIIVTIPDNEENNILEKYLYSINVKIFRGSENNVLKRFYDASKNENPTQIVRICADNPLIDSNEIDNLINFYKENPCDYAYNHIPKNNMYPDGLGAEIISHNILKQLYNTVTLERHKEHCFSYIHDNPSKFNIKTFNPLNKKLHRPELKFDVDTFDDYYKLSMKNININTTSLELIKIFGENK